jgi:hypothetical protein
LAACANAVEGTTDMSVSAIVAATENLSSKRRGMDAATATTSLWENRIWGDLMVL